MFRQNIRSLHDVEDEKKQTKVQHSLYGRRTPTDTKSTRTRVCNTTRWGLARRNRSFALLSGLETGHSVAVGQSPAYDFSVFDEQKAVFLVSVSDCSECDSSGLDKPNSSWSIGRLKEYLRKKRGHS